MEEKTRVVGGCEGRGAQKSRETRLRSADRPTGAWLVVGEQEGRPRFASRCRVRGQQLFWAEPADSNTVRQALSANDEAPPTSSLLLCHSSRPARCLPCLLAACLPATLRHSTRRPMIVTPSLVLCCPAPRTDASVLSSRLRVIALRNTYHYQYLPT